MVGCGPMITGKCTKTQEDPITLRSIFCNIKQMDNLMVSSIIFQKRKFSPCPSLFHSQSCSILSFLPASSHSHRFPFHSQSLSFQHDGNLINTLTISICPLSFDVNVPNRFTLKQTENKPVTFCTKNICFCQKIYFSEYFLFIYSMAATQTKAGTNTHTFSL